AEFARERRTETGLQPPEDARTIEDFLSPRPTDWLALCSCSLFSCTRTENIGYRWPMPRRSPGLREVDAQEALLSALMSLGIEADLDTRLGANEQPDFLIRIGDTVVVGEVKSIVTRATAEQLVRWAKRLHQPAIVVADRIAEDAKASMRRAGLNYLDRRGELRLFDGLLKVDAKVPASLGMR